MRGWVACGDSASGCGLPETLTKTATAIRSAIKPVKS